MKESSKDLWLGVKDCLFPIRKVKSPHFNERPENATVSLIVIHNISLPPEQFGGGYVEAFFQGNLDESWHPYFKEIVQLKVSSHFLIKRSGESIQFVDLNQRAWHAGQSIFLSENDCNNFSIGIELEGSDHQSFTSEQYQQLTCLCCKLMDIFPDITPERILGHSDISPQRKTDPGPFFNWRQFLKQLHQKINSTN